MAEQLTREQMIELVDRLQRGEGDEEEADRWTEALERFSGDPNISDRIFYPESEDLSAAEIVDQALAHQSIPLGPTSDARTDEPDH
ncbi:hypothetical protein ACH35V_01350 [Actinomadura sp. 1N219]|uniref:hypothetical protein n=1 Tax=Actinomadura sp. 1N219 TaxID=3375152 RepID=UPI0037B21B4C